jgi:phosphoglycerol transferase MdoB-like AlkP superfamily enzyme
MIGDDEWWIVVVVVVLEEDDDGNRRPNQRDMIIIIRYKKKLSRLLINKKTGESFILLPSQTKMNDSISYTHPYSIAIYVLSFIILVASLIHIYRWDNETANKAYRWITYLLLILMIILFAVWLLLCSIMPGVGLYEYAVMFVIVMFMVMGRQLQAAYWVTKSPTVV